ncbi:MAG: SMP-30/gluconolactonase/LRE family protein [Porticoccaceae bacterium]|jgi:L-arabinonolactonase|nr:SMP-30/gluconolactonase/LRE family protein [Porticoccaceae bacterium]MDG1080267.1 SMP-30/gluconolactonase/LRE family protein [Porticoccaceae bacterium]
MAKSVVSAALIESLKVKNTLGEGIIWDAASACVWWTDIDGSKLYRYQSEDKQLDHWTTPERLGSFALVSDSEFLICGFASGFAYFNPHSGELQWLEKIEQNNPGTRLNDGRADRQGRFWAGSMVESGDRGAGALYCFDQQLQVASKVSGLTISNGLCWSPDSTVMYHTDTPSRRIHAYDFDAATGAIANQRCLVRTEKGCFPDGSSVDAEGYIWNAQWGASQVVRYSPEGEVDFVLPLPVSQPTCVAFGGPRLDRLFVTSATQGFDEQTLSAEPEAGNVLVFQTNISGIADARFTAS